MAFKSEFIAGKLGDYWRRFKELEVLKGYWDGLIELTSNISLNLAQINKGKALSTVPVFHASGPALFVFDGTTAIAGVPAGYQTAYRVAAEITSIPSFASISDGSGTVLFEGSSYRITSPGVLAFTTIPPQYCFADRVLSDRRVVFKNFGYPVDYDKPTSDLYKRQVTGLWYALWNGAAVDNIVLGLHILLGLPFAQKGKVLSVVTNLDGTKTIVVDNETYTLPAYLDPTVYQGQEITNFTRLSTGVTLYDFVNNPDFFELVDLPEVQKFFTFLPVVLADVITAIELETGELYDVAALMRFIRRIKPAYTDFILGILLKLYDGFQLFVESTHIEEFLLFTKTVDINYMNYLIVPRYAVVNGIPGATLQDQVNFVKDKIEFALDEERIAFEEDLTIVDNAGMVLTSTVGDGPVVEASPAAGVNPVNHFSIGAGFETLNGLTLAEYNDHLMDYPRFDLDLEKVALTDELEIRDLISGLPLVNV